MKIKITGLNEKSEIVELPQPIWFEFLVNNFGTNREFKFFFLKKLPDNLLKIQVQIDNDKPQPLIVDKLTKTISKNLETFELVAGSPLNLIWQNYVKPETFKQLTLNTMFEKFCKPFQIESIHPNLKLHTPCEFFTVLGMTYWDVVQLFFIKNFNSTVFVNQNKQITTKFKISNAPELNTNSPDIINFKNLTDQTKLLTSIMIQLPDDESDQFVQLKQPNLGYEQLNINRTKFFKMPKQFALLQNKGAKTVMDQEKANYKTIEIELARLLTPLWPGSILTLIDGKNKFNLCVSSFRTALSKNGPSSKIKFFYSDLIN